MSKSYSCYLHCFWFLLKASVHTYCNMRMLTTILFLKKRDKNELFIYPGYLQKTTRNTNTCLSQFWNNTEIQ